jgi:hypothetical protein
LDNLLQHDEDDDQPFDFGCRARKAAQFFRFEFGIAVCPRP